MTITRSQGCAAFWINVDGQDINELTVAQRDEIISRLFLTIRTMVHENDLCFDSLLNLVEPDEIYHDDSVCARCGDTVTRETWRL